MRPGTVRMAVSKVISRIGLTLLALFMKFPLIALLGVAVILFAVAAYFFEKKSQTGYWW